MKTGSITGGAGGHSAAAAALGATAGAGAGVEDEGIRWLPLGGDPMKRDGGAMLHEDAMEHILSFLDKRSLGRLTQVSGRGYAVAQEVLGRIRGYNDVSIYDAKLLMERFVEAAKPYPMKQDRLKAMLEHHRGVMHLPGVSNDDLIKAWRIYLHRWPLTTHKQNKKVLVELFKKITIDVQTLDQVLSLAKARINDADKFRDFIEDMLTNDDIGDERKAVVFSHYLSVANDAKKMKAYWCFLNRYLEGILDREIMGKLTGSLSRVRLGDRNVFCNKLKDVLLNDGVKNEVKGLFWIVLARQSTTAKFIATISECMEAMERGLFSKNLLEEMLRSTSALDDDKKTNLTRLIIAKLSEVLVPTDIKLMLWNALKAEHRSKAAIFVLSNPSLSDADKQLAWKYFLESKPKLVERVKAHLRTLLMGRSLTGFSKGGVAVIMLMLVAAMAYALRYAYLAGMENRYDQWNPRLWGDRCVLDMQVVRKHIAKNRGKTAEEIQSFKAKWGYYQEGFDAARARQIRPGDECFLTKRQVDHYLKALWKESSNWDMKLREFRELNGRGYVGGWKDAMALWFMKG